MSWAWISPIRLSSHSGLRRGVGAVVFAGLWWLLLLSGCADEDSPEQQIRNMIDAAAEAVEQRALVEAKSFISPDYLDRQQRTRRDITRLLAGYFLRHKSIHLLTQINRIELPQKDRAQLLMFVAMAGRPIEDVKQLIAFRADLFRIDLQLVLVAGDWRVQSGRWRRANSSDFLE